jgi:O-methyltransferase involved in polyketide biosynthesis
LDLTQVSRTAILLLICRAVTAQKDPMEFNDPMAVFCLERLMSLATGDDKKWIEQQKRKYEGLHARDAIAGTRRGMAFDKLADHFITENPNCTVINLACGFDTRFWRIKNEKCKFLEIDLPGVIELKTQILKEHLEYDVIACSALEPSWIKEVTVNGNARFLLIAEGLFMWFSPQEAINLFKEIGEKFCRSQLILDIVPEKFTKGLWKQLIRLHSRIDWGLDVAWNFGVKNSVDIEAYGNHLKVIGEEKGSAGSIITISINAA